MFNLYSHCKLEIHGVAGFDAMRDNLAVVQHFVAVLERLFSSRKTTVCLNTLLEREYRVREFGCTLNVSTRGQSECDKGLVDSRVCAQHHLRRVRDVLLVLVGGDRHDADGWILCPNVLGGSDHMSTISLYCASTLCCTFRGAHGL